MNTFHLNQLFRRIQSHAEAALQVTGEVDRHIAPNRESIQEHYPTSTTAAINAHLDAIALTINRARRTVDTLQIGLNAPEGAPASAWQDRHPAPPRMPY